MFPNKADKIAVESRWEKVKRALTVCVYILREYDLKIMILQFSFLFWVSISCVWHSFQRKRDCFLLLFFFHFKVLELSNNRCRLKSLHFLLVKPLPFFTRDIILQRPTFVLSKYLWIYSAWGKNYGLFSLLTWNIFRGLTKHSGKVLWKILYILIHVVNVWNMKWNGCWLFLFAIISWNFCVMDG